MKQRFEELDSLRGLAALAVLNSHFLNVLPIFTRDIHSETGLWLAKLIRYTPLRFIYAGQESVMLFFVLSGFVLSLPFLIPNSSISYFQYIFKRICRIYIPYIVSVFIAISMCIILKTEYIEELSQWFNDLNWHHLVTPGVLINHIILVGQFDTSAFNNVIWSLVHEMRISLIFPLLMILITRFSWIINILLGLVLSLSGMLLTKWLGPWTLTLHYIFMFIIGAVLAKHRTNIVNAFIHCSAIKKIAIFLVGFLLFSYFRVPNWSFLPMGNIGNYVKMISQWGQSIGAAILITAALSSGFFSKILNIGVIKYIGKISYSLYLYHCIVLFVGINLLHGLMNIWLILLICLLSSVAVSSIAYYMIELSAISLGKFTIGNKKKSQLNNAA